MATLSHRNVSENQQPERPLRRALAPASRRHALFRADNEVVSIPRRTCRRHNGFIDGVNVHAREACLCQEGPECWVLIKPEAMLKHGTADGAPRGKHTENQSTTVAKHTTQLAKINERIGPEIDRVQGERLIETLGIRRNCGARALSQRDTAFAYSGGVELSCIGDHGLRNVE